MAPSETSQASKSLLGYLKSWGTSSVPPVGLATLIISLHSRPLQVLPLVFSPLLFFSSYLNVAGFTVDSAGMTAAWSGLYVLLAARRRPVSLRKKFSARGAVRGLAMGLGTMNSIAGGYAYATGNRQAEELERRERNRWGIYRDE